MQKSIRFDRVAKLAGFPICLLIVVAFLLSNWLQFDYQNCVKGTVYWLRLDEGFVSLVVFDGSMSQGKFWVRQSNHAGGDGKLGFLLPSWETTHMYGKDVFFTVYGHMWQLLLIAAIPTVLVFLRTHQRPLRGHCQRCTYDLTGNISGICPECGTPIPKEVREKLAAEPQSSNARSDNHGSQSVGK